MQMIQQQANYKKINATNIDSLIYEFDENKDVIHFKVQFIDLSLTVSYPDIPFHIIYDRCEILNLNLKGFSTNQQDFNSFCETIPSFTNLKQLSLRFFNKKIQNLDSLFINVSHICNVKLNLQDFKKISITEEFKLPMKIEELSINLSNSSFKNKQSQNKFEEYIERQLNLSKLKLKISKTSQFAFFLRFKEKKLVEIDLTNYKVDFKFCEALVEFIHQNKIENITVDKTRIIIQTIYLENNGFKVNSKEYLYHRGLLINFEKLTPEDMEQIEEIIIYLKINKHKCTFLQVKGLENEKFDSMILPIQHLYKDMEYYRNDIISLKNNDYWRVQLYDDYYFERYQIKHTIINAVNLQLKTSLYQSVEKILLIMNSISTNEYLTGYHINESEIAFQVQYVDGFSRNLKMAMCSLMVKQMNIINLKTMHKLQFIAFKRNIFDLIPLPSQIFYDLIDA